jgi:Tfp pilus assembly protein PilV
MDRVYLLLRDNIQSGPYAFDELLQQQLLASDLIWVEGKSTAWAYPYEIEDLKGSLTGQSVEAISMPSVIPVAVKAEKPVIEVPRVEPEKELPKIPSKPVKKRKDEIEIRAEELRKKAMAFSHYHKDHHIPSFHESKEFRPYVKENDAVYFVHHNSGRRAPVGEILVAAMVLGLVVLGWYGGADKYFFQRKSPAINTVASQMVTTDMHAAALSVKNQEPQVADTTNVTATDSIATGNINYTAAYTGKQNSQVNKTGAASPDSQVLITDNQQQLAIENSNKEIEKPVLPEKKKSEPEVIEKDTTDKVEKKQTVAETKKKEEEKKAETQQNHVEEDEEKKKGLGGVLKGLFKKKKKDKE